MHIKGVGSFTNKPWPENEDEDIKENYDEDFLIDFYNLNQNKDDVLSNVQYFYTRYFVSNMCYCLNEQDVQKVLRTINLKPRFDIDKSGKIVICRFNLPLQKKVKKLCVSFLLDTLYTDCMEMYSYGIVYDAVHFTFISRIIE